MFNVYVFSMFAIHLGSVEKDHRKLATIFVIQAPGSHMSYFNCIYSILSKAMCCLQGHKWRGESRWEKGE